MKHYNNLLDNPIYENKEAFSLQLPFIENIDKNFVIKRYKSEKFENHHHEIEYYINSININNNFLYCIDAYIILFERSNSTLINYLIEDLQKYKNIAESLGKKFICLIDALLEAPSYDLHLQWFFDRLYASNILSKEEILIISGAYYQYEEVNNAMALDAAFNGNFPHNTIEKNLPDFHFVSLARQTKPHRIIATVEILKRNLEKYGNCSLGSGYNKNFDKNKKLIEMYCPPDYVDKFPLYIDGEVLGNQQFDISHPLIKNSFVNVIMESGFEIKNGWGCWQLPFITEKTMKSFVLGQIPIFIACRNTLQKIRELNFDLFDDIIDHSYDYELDPILRIKKAIDQLEKITHWTIEDCRKFKQENMFRFEKNFQTYLYIRDNHKIMTIQNLQKALDRYKI